MMDVNFMDLFDNLGSMFSNDSQPQTRQMFVSSEGADALERAFQQSAAEQARQHRQQIEQDVAGQGFWVNQQIKKNVETLLIGGPNNGSIHTMDSMKPSIKYYQQSAMPMDYGRAQDTKYREEKTLVIDEDGNQKWVGWVQSTDPAEERLDVTEHTYRVVKVAVNVGNARCSIVLGIHEELHSSLFMEGEYFDSLSIDDIVEYLSKSRIVDMRMFAKFIEEHSILEGIQSRGIYEQIAGRGNNAAFLDASDIHLSRFNDQLELENPDDIEAEQPYVFDGSAIERAQDGDVEQERIVDDAINQDNDSVRSGYMAADYAFGNSTGSSEITQDEMEEINQLTNNAN